LIAGAGKVSMENFSVQENYLPGRLQSLEYIFPVVTFFRVPENISGNDRE